MGSEISLIPTYVWTSPSILPFLKSHFTLLVSAKSHFRRVRSTTAQWGGKVEFGYVSKLVKWVWWWRGRGGGCSDSLHHWLASRYMEVTSENWLQGWLATLDGGAYKLSSHHHIWVVLAERSDRRLFSRYWHRPFLSTAIRTNCLTHGWVGFKTPWVGECRTYSRDLPAKKTWGLCVNCHEVFLAPQMRFVNDKTQE